MDIFKASAWAQVLSLPFAVYCAYGTFVNLYQPPIGEPWKANLMTVSPVMLVVGFSALATCLLIIVIARIAELVPGNMAHENSDPPGEVNNFKHALDEERRAHAETREKLSRVESKILKIVPPNLIVQFVNDKSLGHGELFEVTNFGPGLVQKLEFNGIIIVKNSPSGSYEERLEVTLFDGIGVLQERIPQYVQFSANDGQTGKPLHSWIREHLEPGYDIQASLTINYSDLEETLFFRGFELSLDTKNRVHIEAVGLIQSVSVDAT